MKRLQIFAILTILASALGSVKVAEAKRVPMISPSVKAAARLKYTPPRNWIRHYLGDDRYKIAGGIWKVVTVPNDRYYYPAYAREMLRRSPNNVIGFASGEEAQEAGYAPHPSYFNFYGASTVEVVPQGANGNSAMRTNSAQRIRLSDGISSLILPAGWRHARQPMQTPNGITMNVDDFRSPRSGAVRVISMVLPNIPAGTDISRFMTPEMLRQYSSGFGGGVVNNSMGNTMNNLSMRRITLGGLRGVAFRPRSIAGLRPNEIGEAYMVGRGSKMHLIAVQGSRRTPGVTTILNSFRPR